MLGEIETGHDPGSDFSTFFGRVVRVFPQEFVDGIAVVTKAPESRTRAARVGDSRFAFILGQRVARTKPTHHQHKTDEDETGLTFGLHPGGCALNSQQGNLWSVGDLRSITEMDLFPAQTPAGVVSFFLSNWCLRRWGAKSGRCERCGYETKEVSLAIHIVNGILFHSRKALSAFAARFLIPHQCEFQKVLRNWQPPFEIACRDIAFSRDLSPVRGGSKDCLRALELGRQGLGR